MGEPGLVLGLTGADTGLEGRGWEPLEKSPLEGLPELKGLSTCRETDKRVRPQGCVHSQLSRVDLALLSFLTLSNPELFHRSDNGKVWMSGMDDQPCPGVPATLCSCPAEAWLGMGWDGTHEGGERGLALLLTFLTAPFTPKDCPRSGFPS